MPTDSPPVDFSSVGGTPVTDGGTQASEQATTPPPSVGAHAGGLATRRNAAAQPGITPETRQNRNPVTGQPQNLMGIAWAGKVAQKIQELKDMTQDEKAQHPVKADIGELLNRAEDLLVGNPSHGGMRTGFLTNPVTGMLIPGGEEGSLAAEATEAGGQALDEGIQTARQSIPPAETASSAAEESPGILQKIKNVFKGEKVAQPQAESAVRSAVEQGSKEAGMSITQPASLRTVAETPISKLETMADARYAEIDEAAGTDFKALNEKLSNTEYKIRQLTETEEDIAKEAALEKSRTGIIEKIAAAKEQARAAGVDPKLLDEADAQFKQAQALKDFEAKILKNSGVVGGNTAAGTPETINIEKATSAIQKLADSTKYGGSRLEQALGKQGADQLLKSMYAAQRAGVAAMKTQTLAKWIAGIIGAGTVAAGGKAAYDVLR